MAKATYSPKLPSLVLVLLLVLVQIDGMMSVLPLPLEPLPFAYALDTLRSVPLLLFLFLLLSCSTCFCFHFCFYSQNLYVLNHSSALIFLLSLLQQTWRDQNCQWYSIHCTVRQTYNLLDSISSPNDKLPLLVYNLESETRGPGCSPRSWGCHPSSCFSSRWICCCCCFNSCSCGGTTKVCSAKVDY